MVSDDHCGFSNIWKQDGFEPQKIHLNCRVPCSIYVPINANLPQPQLYRLFVECELDLLKLELSEDE